VGGVHVVSEGGVGMGCMGRWYSGVGSVVVGCSVGSVGSMSSGVAWVVG